MPAKKSRRPAQPPADSAPSAPRELIVLARTTSGLRARGPSVASVGGAKVDSLNSALASEHAKFVPMFGPEERIARAAAAPKAAPPDADVAADAAATLEQMSSFYKVEAPEAALDSLAQKLLKTGVVEAAYVRPRVEPPVMRDEPIRRAAIRPTNLNEAPPISPSFLARQIYLDAAPAGIDARYAWTRPGGKGEGIRIIDIEGAWRFTHEDLVQSQGGVIGGVQSTDPSWRNHGTAVVGVFGGDENGFGITGIAPAANARAISFFGPGESPAKAIADAANALSPGDIILIELHAAGPRYNFTPRSDQRGYIAMEFWPDVFAAILYATSVRGVIVVEAAGNGAEDLDDLIYSDHPPGFPPSWRNPFDRVNPQSGAILVGAGAPPPGTHGNNYGPDRSRLGFSNYGSRVDAQGWGREVTTCGYGDLQGGSDEDLWYTDVFSGTSSASPIVVGAIACTQGARKAAGQALLTPDTARALLRSTGSPQQDGPIGPATEHIGSRPNLRHMIPATPFGVQTVPLHRYWNSALGDHFYTTDLNELGSGGGHGWVYERIQCYVIPQQRPGAIPLHRYWNQQAADHFYTTDWAELGNGRFGWVYEGILCYVYGQQSAGSVPLHRYWSPGARDHFYTTDWAELGYGRFGWNYEGIQCYVFAEQVTAPGAPAEPTTAQGETELTADVEDVPESFRTAISTAEYQPASFETKSIEVQIHSEPFESKAAGIGQSSARGPNSGPKNGP